MAVTINGITCQELVDGYTENYDVTGGPGARKGYLCNWSDRFTVIHGILGLSTTISVGGLITLKTPLPYPELAAESTNLLASMYARSVEVYGVGPPLQGGNNITFTSAKVYVTFGAFPWSFSGIDYFQLDPTRPYIWAEQNLEFGAEYITLPNRTLKYATSGKFVGSPFSFPSPLVDMSIRLINIPYLPQAQALAASLAPLNSVRFLNCAPGTLLFKGMQTHKSWSTDGTRTVECTIGFSFRPIAPWDQQVDPSTGIWDQVVTFVGGNTVLARSDLSTIIPGAYV